MTHLVFMRRKRRSLLKTISKWLLQSLHAPWNLASSRCSGVMSTKAVFLKPCIFAGDLSVLVSSVGGINTSVNGGPDIINNPQCLETSLMSKVVEDAAPYLYPCSIQYSLICAGQYYKFFQLLNLFVN